MIFASYPMIDMSALMIALLVIIVGLAITGFGLLGVLSGRSHQRWSNFLAIGVSLYIAAEMTVGGLTHNLLLGWGTVGIAASLLVGFAIGRLNRQKKELEWL